MGAGMPTDIVRPLLVSCLLSAQLIGCAGEDRTSDDVDASAPDPDAGTTPPDTGVGSDPDASPPCSGETGTFRAQSIDVDGEPRYYYLHVPETYDCTAAPAPALFDLHGTAGPFPEEAYGLAAAVATADREGLILVRPRSRFSDDPTFGETYRWDQNPGDVERNRAFLHALVVDLSSRYSLDATRLYLMGFSSGTNQTAALAADDRSPFDGYGFVGGGAWTPDGIARTDARFYMNTGFRDYMWSYHDTLVMLLDVAGVPDERRFVSETDAGHDLYGWMYDELFPFLDRGERPSAPTPAGSFVTETVGTDATLLATATLPGGDVVAVGEGATIVVRDAETGTWTERVATGASLHDGSPLTAVCATDAGLVLAVGGGLVVRSIDGGLTWDVRPPAPDASSGFGYSHLEGIDCGASGIVGGGYWTGVSTSDGLAFEDVTMDAGGYRAQVAAVRAAPWGTWLATGYYAYLGRSEDGVTFTKIAPGAPLDWAFDAAPAGANTWIVVGDGGHVARSSDDARTFASVRDGGEDLYAVRFRDENTGLAVGRRCTVLSTDDGGRTFTPAGCGLRAALTDVAWLTDGTALIVGEAGLALRFDPDL